MHPRDVESDMELLLVRLFLGQEESGLMIAQRQAPTHQECIPLQPLLWVSLTIVLIWYSHIYHQVWNGYIVVFSVIMHWKDTIVKIMFFVLKTIITIYAVSGYGNYCNENKSITNSMFDFYFFLDKNKDVKYYVISFDIDVWVNTLQHQRLLGVITGKHCACPHEGSCLLHFIRVSHHTMHIAV